MKHQVAMASYPPTAVLCSAMSFKSKRAADCGPRVVRFLSVHATKVLAWKNRLCENRVVVSGLLDYFFSRWSSFSKRGTCCNTSCDMHVACSLRYEAAVVLATFPVVSIV